MGTKASIRFKFTYWQVRNIMHLPSPLKQLSVLTPVQDIPDAKFYTDKRKQVNVRRGRRKDGIPISLRAIAGHVRSELMAEMVSVASPVSFEDGDRVLTNALQRHQWHI